MKQIRLTILLYVALLLSHCVSAQVKNTSITEVDLSNTSSALTTLFNFGVPSISSLSTFTSVELDQNFSNPFEEIEVETIAKFQRNESVWSEIRWVIPEGTAFDFLTEKSFSIALYFDQPSTDNVNKNIWLILRKDGTTTDQKVMRTEIIAFDQWDEYSFDFSNFTAEELEGFNTVSLFIAPQDTEGLSTGLSGYIAELKGPRILSDFIMTSNVVVEDGKSIVLNVLSADPISSSDDPQFELKINDEIVNVTSIGIQEQSIQLHLEKEVIYNDKVELSYKGGNITDSEGKVLTYFENQLLINTVRYQIEEIYSFGAENNFPTLSNFKLQTNIVDNFSFTEDVPQQRITEIVKEEDLHSYLQVDLNGVISMQKDKVFRCYIYQPSQDNIPTNNNIKLRVLDTEDPSDFYTITKNITVQDQWVAYEFDFSQINFQGDSYNLLRIYLGSPDTDFAGTSCVYYFSTLEGPPVKYINDATLSAITIDGQPIENFDSSLFEYDFEIPYAQEEFPLIEATPNNANATVEVVSAEEIPGTVSIQVTAEDGTTTLTYQVNITRALPSQNTNVTSLYIDGNVYTAFDQATESYTLEYPFGTTSIPVLDLNLESAVATYSIIYPESLPGTIEVEVTAQDPLIKKKYTFEVILLSPSDNVNLSSIFIDGKALEGFSNEENNYNVAFDLPNTTAPYITLVLEDETTHVQIQQAWEIPGAGVIELTAQDGTRREITILFIVNELPSSDAFITSLYHDGSPMEEFNSTVLDYYFTVAEEMRPENLPDITEIVKSHSASTFTVTKTNFIPGTTKIEVVAEDGITMNTYQFHYRLPVLSSNTLLKEIRVDGQLLSDFSNEINHYSLTVEGSTMPEITVVTEDENAKVNIIKATAFGQLTLINVMAEDGVTKNVFALLINSTADPVLSLDSLDDAIKVYAENDHNLIIEQRSVQRKYQLLVYDCNGKIVYHGEHHQPKNKIPIKAKGLIIIQVVFERNRVVKKVWL
ncbi:cadherin-like beta sandwich domain-containing protein [Flammeovirga sp. EKP202]|uniref:cadherin-like beta sandwich domain-containing protein n=1 Tax=Flammeovirga sp. EKP202 TaxID=2770592 RepID=UPI00165F0087|nr:cadherin-like beta sandwich domain-containing protein [Flammeovirga sp. EKP202]MBD0400257.1 cadherin-like beta sandwich domain-containing protein [Flammeovirga sp. EKP202]